ncbi:1-deoxy-D-xylulose-5-phosphate synthase, partial [bacterium]
MLLDKIRTPQDLKGWSLKQLGELATEVRSFLIESISRTGGHIGANLGVVELTIALHRVFDADQDKFLFDVGHQGYTHKLLTGRREIFSTLNTPGGMSRFLTPSESPYDVLDASHAGTAISVGSGLAQAMLHDTKPGLVVAVIGDGSLVEGMSYEALNFVGDQPLPMVLVINDNGMSIPPNVGGIRHLFAHRQWEQKCEAYFTGLGYRYQAVPDGHDLEDLVLNFSKARQIAPDGPVVVHVKTEKGRGLAIARDHPYKLHFSMPFDPATGAGSSPVPPGRLYTAIVGETLGKLIDDDKDIYALTPATPYASGLDAVMVNHPGRVLDVGMAEQHAAGMAAGLAMAGKKVFACYQSTFLQRAMDQLIHDIAYLKLPVTIIAARSGFAGFDSPTHHGIYDLSWLQAVPNLKIFYAGTSRDLQAVLKDRAQAADGPLVILHPYEAVWSGETEHLPAATTPLEQPEVLSKGADGLILTVGNRLPTGVALRDQLRHTTDAEFELVNVRWLNPLPTGFLETALENGRPVITLEEGRARGGFGAAMALFLADRGLVNPLHISAVRDEFVPTGDKDALSVACGLD